MRNALLGLLMVVVSLSVMLVLRTLSYTPGEFPAVNIQTLNRHALSVDSSTVAQHLSEAITFRTVSAQLSSQSDHEQFERFISWLAQTYPQVHSQLRIERVGRYSLLFTWQGTQPDLAPILLSAHYDVVPVIPGTENLWTHPPYSGHIDQTHIWGRGALDDKSAVVSIMEAVTVLLSTQFQPVRTVYLSLTHDEETGGDEGTAAVVETLNSRGVKLAWSLDEGSFLLKDFFPGIETPLASINVAEKGFLTLDITARGEGGHSSMPPTETAVGILAAALLKLQNNPLPAGLDGLSGKSIDTVARHMPFGKRLLFANRWLFGRLIESTLSKTPATNAMLRTTTAPTMLAGSVKDNVLAIEATGTVNFRVHPRDTVNSIVEYVESIINDERITIAVREAQEASRVSSSQAEGYQHIVAATLNTYGEVMVSPGITIAGTDSRRYEQVADNAYRFNPMVITPEDITGFHGTNERISIYNMVNAVSFYGSLIQNAASD